MTPLVKALSEIKGIKKDAQNPFLKNKYISLDNIIDNAKPILSENGISIIQSVTSDGVETFLLHTSGEWISSGVLLITPQESKGLSMAQSMGVATTYAKRYQLGSMICINADEDTDGQYGDNSGLVKTDGKQWLSDNQFQEVMARMRKGETDFLPKLFDTFQIKKEQADIIKKMEELK